MAVAAAAASTKDVEHLDIWVFERVFYENHPGWKRFDDCAGHLANYAIVEDDLESLRDATLPKDIEGLCIDLSCYTYRKEDNDPKVENFEKLKFLNVLEASLISLDCIRGLPELRVLVCNGFALQALSRLRDDELATSIASLPKLRCIVTYDYELFPDSLLLPHVFPVSLRSLALMRACNYDYSFLLHLPNLENLHLDLSNCENHNVLDTLRRLPYNSKLLRFGTIDQELLRNVQADKLYSTAQNLLDGWPNLRQLSVDLPGFGVTKQKALRFPRTIQVLKLTNCGPFKLKALLLDYKQLKFLAVFTDRVNSKDLKILRHCYRTKTMFMGNFKVYLREKFSTTSKYHFILSKSSTEDGSTSYFNYVYENFYN
ncbi:uncharacterized protein LOC116417553 [Nasonia vitripennis]|uniref:Uncharacterized protein n=1 Tax=Nasonia vitripennis TaxID=7425 RepID=A0A7M7QFG6_NASVI|nr:uncharacterized protein LOC116417553 [Nasonia vitripennis]XP_031786876.1 uncharacterized protein LOC116417553 [Nasonia vitripennis]XP_031786877.1 uncharacterized protein LOC116417553 [Nasonia vitripennis]